MRKFLILSLLFSQNLYAIEENVFKVNGNDSQAIILEKLGAPKNAVMPAEFKNKETEIKVEHSTDKMITIDFTPAHSFTITDADLFEKVDTKEKSDMVNQKLIIADPKTGRIFHLNYELKVSKLELLPPWTTKNKLKSLKEIMTGATSQKIEKKK